MGLQIGERVPHLPHPRERADRMACHEVHLSFEEGLRRDLLASCPEFADVDLPYLIPALPGCGVAGGLAGLPVGFAAFPLLALLLLPVFVVARPWIVGVLFPGPIRSAAWAFAELLPDGQGHGHAPGKRTSRVAGTAAQSDDRLQAMRENGRASSGTDMPALLVRTARTGAGPAARVKAASSIRRHEPLPLLEGAGLLVF